MKRTQVALVCLPILNLIACGGEDPAPSLAELQASTMKKVCEFEVRCNGTPDVESCLASNTVDDLLPNEIKAGRIKYDGHKAQDCLNAFVAPLADCSVGKIISFEAPDSCATALVGTIAGGGVCYSDDSCVTGHCDLPINAANCDSSTSCCPGTCAATATKTFAIGEDCKLSVGECVKGSFCAEEGVCKAKGKRGESCTEQGGCVAGSVCVSTSSAPAGVCGDAPKTGEACNEFSPTCDRPDDFCDTNTSKCTRQVKVGQPCITDSTCVAYAKCDVATSTCVARPKLGEACDLQNVCINGLDCSAGTCTGRTSTPGPTCP